MAEYKGKYVAGRDLTIVNRLKSVASQFSFWVGLGLTLFITTLSLSHPCPTASQFQLFRIALAIGIASFAGSLPGFFKIKSVILKTGTGLAVFLISYFTNPATIVKTDDCNSDKVLHGKVFFAGSPLTGVRVEVPALNEFDITNAKGTFDIPYSKSVKLPIRFRFIFKAIDTVVDLDSMPVEETWLISLPDTIPVLQVYTVEKMISGYLEKLQTEVEAEHRREMYRNQGKESSVGEISAKYLPYEKINSNYRNVIHFTNGFNTLTTHKSIRTAGIRIDPMVPYNAYNLDSYSAYLYQDTVWQDQSRQCILNDFSFLNNTPSEIHVKNLKRTDRIEYRAEVDISNNIRYVKTIVQHTMSNNWVKFQKTVYKGTRPKEEFIIRYQNGEWQIFDTKE